MKATAARINTFLAWLIFAGANLQIFLIALSVFGAASSEVHAWSGRVLMLFGLLAAIAAVVARCSRLNIGLSILVMLLLFPVQGIFAYLEFPLPAVNALHAVTGLAILYGSYSLAHGRARATLPAAQDARQMAAAD